MITSSNPRPKKQEQKEAEFIRYTPNPNAFGPRELPDVHFWSRHVIREAWVYTQLPGAGLKELSLGSIQYDTL